MHFAPLFRVLLLLVVSSRVIFAADPVAEAEIDHLLASIEKSHFRFVRNDTEYPPKEAAAHLRVKLGKAGDRVKTAEDFITGIASKSYLSGKPYRIKLPDGAVQPAGPWLTQELARYRAQK